MTARLLIDDHVKLVANTQTKKSEFNYGDNETRKNQVLKQKPFKKAKRASASRTTDLFHDWK